MFRESGCVTSLASLLKEIFPSSEPEAAYLIDNRVRAGWGLLQLLRQLLVPGESSTPQNQAAIFRVGVAQTLIDLAFEVQLPAIVRVTAFRAAADLIRNNAPLQVNFASLQVHISAPKEPSAQPDHLEVNGNRSAANSARNSARPSMERHSTYIIEALLDLVLHQQRAQYELRVAACAVIQAYLVKHNEIRAHFLQRAIAGHREGEKAPNVLTALLKHHTDDVTAVILAAWNLQDLIANNREAKSAFLAISEGEAAEGEDVLSAIQTLGSELQQALQQDAEERLVVAYASTLCVLLWDFSDGINNLLAEGSSVLQTLMDGTKSTSPVIAGLTATLLGIVYEFSTKDTPIPRKSLSALLTQKLGRDRYLTSLSDLRSDPAVRDFDLPREESERLELSETFFDLYLTEYPRLRRAIDKDPGIEILPYAAAEAGVQRDILDELRTNISKLETALAQSQQEAAQSSEQAQKDKLQSEQRSVTLQKEAEQEKLNLQKDLKAATTEAERIRAVITKMQSGHEDDARKAEQRRQNELEESNIKHARELATVRQEVDRKAQQAKQQAEQGFSMVRQDYERRLTELGNSHRTEQAGHKSARDQLEVLSQQHRDVESKASSAQQELQMSQQKHSELEKSHQQLQTRVEKAESDLATTRSKTENSEKEVADLKTQIAELKEDVKGKEQELQTERSGFAELEKELDSAKKKVTSLEKERDSSKKGSESGKKDLESAKKERESAKKELESAKKDLESSMKNIDSTKKDLESTKKDLESTKKELESTKKELESSKKDTESAKKDAQSAKSTAASASSKNSKKDGEASKQVDKLKSLSDSLAAEVKQLKTDAEKHKKKQEELESQVKDDEGKLKEAQDAEKSAKEELDSLLLVLSEIEGKRDEYKAKIKELGGEVTDDDEEEEEDEDEDHNSDVD